MKTVGIIAEYNPFHNGHTYQIKKIRELTHADYIVVAMSGDFVQRGAPAITDKYMRTQMALSCGADFVIELPALWSTASAENFAMAGVTLFDKMGCVDALCFGAETDNLPLLSMIADVLSEEPLDFSGCLSANLKKGLSFPAARALALTDYLNIQPGTSLLLQQDSLEAVLNAPNNILAIEYLKALNRRSSNITPLLIKREGDGYHDEHIKTPNASATAIRRLLANASSYPASFNRPHTLADSASFNGSSTLNNAVPFQNTPAWETALLEAMPKSAARLMLSCAADGSFLHTDDFSSILNYLLLAHSNIGGFADFGDSNEEISNRLTKNMHRFSSFSQFCELSKSRDITYTRMSRVLLHIILGITNSDYAKGKKLDYIPYLRLLGFQKSASALLSKIKLCSDIPLISKLADAADYLPSDAQLLLQKDIFAADLYEHLLAEKKKTTPRSEFTREIVIIETSISR